jgi:hypothetical protein
VVWIPSGSLIFKEQAVKTNQFAVIQRFLLYAPLLRRLG